MPGEVLLLLHPVEADELARSLQLEGWEVVRLENGQDAIDLSRHTGAGLLILESAPETDGLGAIEILRRIRQQSLMPVLVVSKSENDAERILAFELGADDYLVKPYQPQELMARVRAIMRRSQAGTSGFQHLSRAGEIELDRIKRRAYRAGAEIPLTTAEFDLLDLLLRRSGHPVSREEIAESVLGRRLNPNDRSIDMHISNLRRKLNVEQRGGGPIRAVRGVGYSFVPAM